MELRDYLRVLRKQWRLLVLLPVLTVLAAALVTARAVPQYESSVTFFVTTPASSDQVGTALTGAQFSAQRVRSYANLLTGPQLGEALAERLGLVQSGRSVGAKITAEVQPDTVLLVATVRDADPAQARALAAAIGVDFPELVAELERPAGGGPPAITANVVENPDLPSDPVSPRPLRNLALALVLGLLLGIGVAVARETLDTTIKSAEDVQTIAGVATLGAIAYDPSFQKRPLVVQDEPRAPRAEAFRQVRTNLQFVDVDHGLRSLVVTSSLPAEAKSTSACNIALTLMQAGKRVLLVEADLRRPRVADYMGLEGAVGLTSVLIGQASLEDAVQAWGAGNLDVLPSGPLPPNPAELLGSDGMRRLLKEMEATYDVVILDSPPLLPVTDAAVLATMASGALLCVRVGKTTRDQLALAVENLRAVGAPVLGGLLTLAPRRGPDAYYSYGYGYRGYGVDAARPQLAPQEALEAARDQRRGQHEPAGPTTVVEGASDLHKA